MNLFLRNLTRFNILANLLRIIFSFQYSFKLLRFQFLQSYTLQYFRNLFTNQLFFVPIFAQTFKNPIFYNLTRFNLLANFLRIKILNSFYKTNSNQDFNSKKKKEENMIKSLIFYSAEICCITFRRLARLRTSEPIIFYQR